VLGLGVAQLFIQTGAPRDIGKQDATINHKLT
jgi:hypothetical protein